MKSVPREQQGDQSAWNGNINETATQESGCKRGGRGLIQEDAAYWPMGSEHTESEQRSGKWKTLKVFNRNLKHLEWGSRNMFRKRGN